METRKNPDQIAEKTPASSTSKRPKSGVIPLQQVKTGLFILASCCVLVCVVMSILAIWDYVGNGSAYKTVASCGVLVVGSALFERLNEYFS